MSPIDICSLLQPIRLILHVQLRVRGVPMTPGTPDKCSSLLHWTNVPRTGQMSSPLDKCPPHRTNVPSGMPYPIPYPGFPRNTAPFSRGVCAGVIVVLWARLKRLEAVLIRLRFMFGIVPGDCFRHPPLDKCLRHWTNVPATGQMPRSLLNNEVGYCQWCKS